MTGLARAAGLVLAGGRSRRFGAEKATAVWEGAPLVGWAARALLQGCGRVAVNAPEGSGAAEFARAHGLDLLPDPPALPDGPLAGVLAGLAWLERGAGDVLVTAPCDAPRLPGDLAARLIAGLEGGAPAAYARSPARAHPLCAAWRPDAAPALARALAGGDHPPVRRVLEALGAAPVDFPHDAAFANVNTPDDLAGLRDAADLTDSPGGRI